MFVSVFYYVNLELLMYLDFQGITILLLSALLLNIHTLFFSLTFYFFILLNVSFIVFFVNKLSFMFPLALLILYFFLSFSIHGLYIFYAYIFLFRYLSNHSLKAFRF